MISKAYERGMGQKSQTPGISNTAVKNLLRARQASYNKSISDKSDLSTTSVKKVSENNGSGRRALPKVDGEDMVARAYERGMGEKSQTSANVKAEEKKERQRKRKCPPPNGLYMPQ